MWKRIISFFIAAHTHFYTDLHFKDFQFWLNEVVLHWFIFNLKLFYFVFLRKFANARFSVKWKQWLRSKWKHTTTATIATIYTRNPERFDKGSADQRSGKSDCSKWANQMLSWHTKFIGWDSATRKAFRRWCTQKPIHFTTDIDNLSFHFLISYLVWIRSTIQFVATS